ncbi:MAG: polyphenol oxidase family protein [Solirubrobacteraceae bacterium]
MPPAISELIEVAAPFRLAGEKIAIDLPGACALFTTRRGGCSTGPYRSLNLGFGQLPDDERLAVERNRARLQERLGVSLASARQVHGARVGVLAAAPGDGSAPEPADGHATAICGVAPMVLTADCLPIAIAGDGAVAMVHAGWRGLAAGIVAAGVSALRALGARGPLAAAVGPGAGRCCYEVGEETRTVFAAHGPRVRHGRNLDLKAIARTELARAGVNDVHDCELCTICVDSSLFYSHRRDRGVTGRQAGIAWLT